MARIPKPWYHTAREEWWVCLNGRQIRLAKGRSNKKAALKEFHRLMAEDRKVTASLPAEVTLGDLCDFFLEHVERHRAPLTLEFHQRHLKGFCQHAGKDTPASSVKPFHVTRWLNSHEWSNTTRHQAITSIKAAFEWGRRQGHLPANQLKDLEKPGIALRTAILSAEQADAVIAAIPDRDRAFRNLLIVLRETGCRPSEATRVEAQHLDLGNRRIVMPGKTTRKTKRPRAIYLSEAALTLFAELAQQYPEGPLLRNRRGRPWTRNAIALRFQRLHPRLGLGAEATAESFRHLFVTDALERGIPIATVAELAGHRGTAMVEARYSHLHDRHDHLLSAVETVRAPKGNGQAPE